jgi:hypothetical protein
MDKERQMEKCNLLILLVGEKYRVGAEDPGEGVGFLQENLS